MFCCGGGGGGGMLFNLAAKNISRGKYITPPFKRNAIVFSFLMQLGQFEHASVTEKFPRGSETQGRRVAKSGENPLCFPYDFT